MPLPVMNRTQPIPAKFANEFGTRLTLQCFVTAKDKQGRIALNQLEGFDGWCMSGENMLVNESPDDAAERVCSLWYETPLKPRLDRVLSFPATGGDDIKWYIVFLYTADAPDDLKATSDAKALAFYALDAPPNEWAMAHDDVWNAL